MKPVGDVCIISFHQLFFNACQCAAMSVGREMREIGSFISSVCEGVEEDKLLSAPLLAPNNRHTV